MKINKKILILFIIVALVCALIIFNLHSEESENIEQFSEYTPQEEISTQQLRQTLITLYFKSKDTGNVVPEARMVDSKILLNDPYLEIMQFLISGPKNENLERLIPVDVKINSIRFEKGIVYLDFSKDFIKTGLIGEGEEAKIIKSIVNSLTELTEVDGVKFYIDGEEGMSFESGKIKLDGVFNREN